MRVVTAERETVKSVAVQPSNNKAKRCLVCPDKVVGPLFTSTGITATGATPKLTGNEMVTVWTPVGMV